MSTGQGIIGNNMFAYCLNNPVNYYDSTGHAYSGIHSQFNYNEYEHTYGGLRENGVYRSLENIALDADTFAIYNGVPVIKVPSMGYSAFSFGIILLGSKVNDENTLKHEYGHFTHLSQIGVLKYSVGVVIPSLFGFWGGVPQSEYYSQPWEYTADILGKVNREGYKYKQEAAIIASIYWLITLLA